jgi:putative FmdB family regulatory protein
MPIYAYRCEACGHEHDALQKISDPPLTDCPACGEPTLKKQLSAAAFRLKGGGWYETDFKAGNKRNLHETGDKPKDKPEGGKDKDKAKPKPDAKPAADKTDSAPKTSSKPAVKAA